LPSPPPWSPQIVSPVSKPWMRFPGQCIRRGEAFEPGLTKAEAAQRIDALQARTGRGR
jgi:hypothetical protein